MIFRETPIAGAVLIELEPQLDERGSFARTFSVDEFAAHGLETRVVQCNASTNPRAGTLRGMHFQLPPFAEAKLLRCARGSFYDVVVDLRPDSATYCEWYGVELSASNLRMLYVPVGLAHGFQTLEDDTHVLYQMSEDYSAEHARGVRWDDPAFGIAWPHAETRIISERDAGFADFRR